MRYIDVHSHVQFAAYGDDRDEVVKRTFDAHTGMINVGTQADTSRLAVELANKYSDQNIWATIGLHPIHTSRSYHDTQELDPNDTEAKVFTSRGEEFDYDYYKQLGQDPKVVAIGEVGLDYYRLDEETKKKQKKAFEQQIELAIELKKPLMLHIRQGRGSGGGKAYNDALDMLASCFKFHDSRPPGDVHFFAGDWETAKWFLNMGFTLSFTGVITFTHDYDEVVRNTPLDMILSETDCPYIAPVPYRGSRNEPANVKYVVENIAKIKNMDIEEVRQQILTNAKRVFGI